MTNANTTLAELRAINIEKQREDKEDAARESKQKSNLTGKPDSNISGNQTGMAYGKQESNKAGSATGPQARRPTGGPHEQPNNHLEGLSVRERLLAEAAGQAAEKVVMKTVSIKMDPALDERLEAHCYGLRKKKQDVIQDALLLYFETVEGA